MTSENKRLCAEILTVGDELLKGSTLNTNAKFLGQMLREDGFRTIRQTACSDQGDAIKSCLGEALGRADFIIVSGGLGPTPDDLTRDAIAEYFSVPLVFSKSQYQLIQKLYRKHGRKIPSIVRKEAEFPENSVPLLNRYGVALGFLIRHGKKRVVALPGVPKELENMYREVIRPRLRQEFSGLKSQPKLIIKTIGISEPEVMRRLGRDFFDDPHEFGIYPQPGEVTLRLYAEEFSVLNRLKQKAKTRLGKDIYAWEEKSLAVVLGELLNRRKKTVAVAESCSAGLLAHEIVSAPGSSRYFKGGVVTYADAMKTKLLGVSPALIKKQGAVSPEVARAMAEKVRLLFDSDYGLAITGVAGPGGGTKKKPVGLVYLSLASKKKTQVWEKQFWGVRDQVQMKSAHKALEALWREIR